MTFANLTVALQALMNRTDDHAVAASRCRRLAAGISDERASAALNALAEQHDECLRLLER